MQIWPVILFLPEVGVNTISEWVWGHAAPRKMLTLRVKRHGKRQLCHKVLYNNATSVCIFIGC